MNVVFPVEYWPSSITIGLASKSLFVYRKRHSQKLTTKTYGFNKTLANYMYKIHTKTDQETSISCSLTNNGDTKSLKWYATSSGFSFWIYSLLRPSMIDVTDDNGTLDNCTKKVQTEDKRTWERKTTIVNTV